MQGYTHVTEYNEFSWNSNSALQFGTAIYYTVYTFKVLKKIHNTDVCHFQTLGKTRQKTFQYHTFWKELQIILLQKLNGKCCIIEISKCQNFDNVFCT